MYIQIYICTGVYMYNEIVAVSAQTRQRKYICNKCDVMGRADLSRSHFQRALATVVPVTQDM